MLTVKKIHKNPGYFRQIRWFSSSLSLYSPIAQSLKAYPPLHIDWSVAIKAATQAAATNDSDQPFVVKVFKGTSRQLKYEPFTKNRTRSRNYVEIVRVAEQRPTAMPFWCDK